MIILHLKIIDDLVSTIYSSKALVIKIFIEFMSIYDRKETPKTAQQI